MALVADIVVLMEMPRRCRMRGLKTGRGAMRRAFCVVVLFAHLVCPGLGWAGFGLPDTGIPSLPKPGIPDSGVPTLPKPGLPDPGVPTLSDQDIQIEELSVALSPQYYLPGRDTVTADFVLRTSVGQDATRPSFDAVIEVVILEQDTNGFVPGNGATYKLETIHVEASEVANRGIKYLPPLLRPEKQFSLDFTKWLTTFYEGHVFTGKTALAVKITVDSSNEVEEGTEGEKNNVFTSDPFMVYPLSGKLFFGGVVTTLNSISLADDPVCGVGNLRIRGGTATWNPSSSTGGWSTVDVDVSGPCVTPRPLKGVEVDLAIVSDSGSVSAPDVQATMGGLTVIAKGNTLDGSGAHPSRLTITLPGGHSFHPGQKRLFQNGGRKLPFKSKGSGAITIDQMDVRLPRLLDDYADIRQFDVTGVGYLHAKALPFLLELKTLSLSPERISGTYSSIHYVYDLAFNDGGSDPSRADPRSTSGVSSNDAHFAHGSGEGTFSLDQEGLFVPSLQFAEGRGISHFPRMKTSWQDFQVAVAKGRLDPERSFLSLRSYSFTMSTDCPGGCGGGGEDQAFALETTKVGIGEDGGIAGRVVRRPFFHLAPSGNTNAETYAGIDSDPGWGPVDGSGEQHMFQRVGDGAFPGILYLPGFEAVGTGGVVGAYDPVPVSRYLLGMRQLIEADDGSSTLRPEASYLLDAPQSRLGNHFMAGVTMGPQYYRKGVSKQPEAGVGRMLDGTFLRVGFGGPADPDFVQIPTGAGTKYVIRPGGITGVFNAESSGDTTTTVYDYRFFLERFGIRLVGNELDSYTWIDGRVNVPGKGNFQVDFSSLGLECSGHLTGGVVDGCADDTAPNCSQVLGNWQTRMAIKSIDFDPEASSDTTCFGGGRRLLRVGASLDIEALDAPLELSAVWTPEGEPADVKLAGMTDHVLDRPETTDDSENMGFAFAMGEAKMMTDGGTDGGWFHVAGKIGLPFWNVLDVDVRLQNITPSRQGQTVVVASDADSAEALASGSQEELDVTYTWGGTGIELSLPVHYQPGRHNARLAPRFIGARSDRSDAMVVVDANAAVDFITPHATTVSFGASADLATLSNRLADEVTLHIDLNDPESIAKADAFLEEYFDISGAPIATAVGDLKGRLASLSELVGSGFDRVLEDAIEAALDIFIEEGIGSDTFAQLASSLGNTEAILPEMGNLIAHLIADVLYESTAGISSDLDEKMVELYLVPERVAQDASTDCGQKKESLLAEVVPGLDAVSGSLNIAIIGMNRSLEVLEYLRNEIEEKVIAADGYISDAYDTLTMLEELIGDPNSPCDNVLVEQFRSRVMDAMSRVRMARTAVEGIQLAGSMVMLAEELPGPDPDLLADTTRTVNDLAENLKTRLGEAESQFGNFVEDVCQSESLITALREIAGRIQEIRGELCRFSSTLENTKQELIGQNVGEGILGEVETMMASTLGVFVSIKDNIDELRDDLADDRDQECGNFVQKWGGEYFQDRLDAAMWMVTQYLVAENLLSRGYLWYYPETGTSFVQEILLVEKQRLMQKIEEGITVASVGLPLADTPSTSQPDAGGSGPASRSGDTANCAQTGISPPTTQPPVAVHHPTAYDLRALIVDTVMNTQMMQETRRKFHESFSEIAFEINNLGLLVFDQINQVIRAAARSLEGRLNDMLQAAKGAVEGFPLKTAGMDGFAVIAGNELERLHLDAEWTMQGSSPEDTVSYNGALDVTSWSANGKAGACLDDPDQGGSTIDARISSRNVRIGIGQSAARLDDLELGFTLANFKPLGAFGRVTAAGPIAFETFTVFDPGFACGIGKYENYLGAAADALFSDVQMDVALLVGKTCNREVLLALDPQVGEFVHMPGGVFQGVYLRGGASIPIWTGGCPFTLGAGADIGAWYLAGSSSSWGGTLRGRAWGEAGCLAALTGSIRLEAQRAGDNFTFRGTGFGVAGAGDCEPATWTSVPRSREDTWCGTCDASVTVEYRDGFSIDEPSASCLY